MTTIKGILHSRPMDFDLTDQVDLNYDRFYDRLMLAMSFDGVRPWVDPDEGKVWEDPRDTEINHGSNK